MTSALLLELRGNRPTHDSLVTPPSRPPRDGRATDDLAADRFTSSTSPSSSTNDLDETTLLARLHAGDDSAFEVIFAQFWGPLWRFARADTRHEDVADDVVQDVFARVWARRRTWAPGVSLHAYLFRAVRNAIINRRKHEQIIDQSVNKLALHTPTVAEDPNTQAEIDDFAQRVDAALARLSEEQRTAVRLRYEHGLRYADVATILGISPAAAEKRIARTIDTLRAWLRA